ncbi:PucR family transcriptional regulator [Bacillus suaedaesalsae]|uniref:Helix-turn-helix domain-containing protein n=1 Tax=Bacillus suaedaesalsae TaxID=2810349 RepID=A0ABS2DH04_9BACI|nr:helix-turn-helix domain-containing protein [Bacillus suaedaesalsae]MBM6617766.1 helix-turn-helix domain-containing protein [Bacillus suaedaesalsae]
MIEKLREEFPSLVLEEKLPTNPEMQYYRLQDGQYIGIHKNELDSKNRNVLSVFLTPIHLAHNVTPLQALWQEVLHTKAGNSLTHLKKHYPPSLFMRFIHFQLQNEVDKIAFEEALSFLSLSHYTVIWMNSISGVIIEEKDQEAVSKSELIDWRNAITSDFYTDVYLYVGDYFKVDEHVHSLYEFENHCSHLSRQYNSSQTVIQSFELIPYLLLHDATVDTRKSIEQCTRDITNDELQDIKTFIECGLNISLAAKTLFMHRNSLQYRVDKFIEKTGIDIKSFQGALVVYLAILSKKF